MNLNPLGGIVDGLAKGLDDLFTSDEEREAAKLRSCEAAKLRS
jgi:hypothetical protein